MPLVERERNLSRAPARCLFVGSKPIALRCLAEIANSTTATLCGVVTIDDRADGRSIYDEIHAAALSGRVGFHVSGGRGDVQHVIDNLAPDIVIVAGWYRVIPAELLARVPLGFLGFHNSLLPKYRGGSPLVWALINGDPVVGVSLFRLSDALDAGDLLGQVSIDVRPDDAIGDLLPRLEDGAADLLRQYLRHPGGDTRAQTDAEATYCVQRSPEDGVIDWTEPAARVHDFIRAQSSPYPGAYSILSGHRMTIQRARRPSITCHGLPGQVVHLPGLGVCVVCGGSSVVTLDRVQLDGGPELSAGEVFGHSRPRLGR